MEELLGYSGESFELLKLPSLWTRSYFVSTAGYVSSETIQRYIEEQVERSEEDKHVHS